MIGLLNACLALFVMTASPSLAGNADDTFIAQMQRKPYDRGNCFHLVGCRGDSIGNMWVDTPQRCRTLGGKSWMDGLGQCLSIDPFGRFVKLRPE